MTHKSSGALLTSLLLSTSLVVASPVFAKTAAETVVKKAPQSKQVQSVQGKVRKNVNKKTDAKRKALIAEAVSSVKDAQDALVALDKKDKKKALKLITSATGKLDVILARDKSLEFIPIDVQEHVLDLAASPEAVTILVKNAKTALNHGQTQQARALLNTLASEIVIQTTSLPVATYPQALKDVVPLIDKGKYDEAKLALSLVLDMMVVSEEVVPLPFLRAQLLLEQAETLAKNDKRSDADNTKLDKIMKAAQRQIKLGEALGYGGKKNFAPLYDELTKIEAKMAGGKSGLGWFGAIKEKLAKFVKH